MNKSSKLLSIVSSSTVGHDSISESASSLKVILSNFIKAKFTEVGKDSEFVVLKSPAGTEVKISVDSYEGEPQNGMGKSNTTAEYHSVYVGGNHYGDINPSKSVEVAPRLAKM